MDIYADLLPQPLSRRDAVQQALVKPPLKAAAVASLPRVDLQSITASLAGTAFFFQTPEQFV